MSGLAELPDEDVISELTRVRGIDALACLYLWRSLHNEPVGR